MTLYFFNRLNKFTRLAFGVGIILLIYGYLCRFVELYFFWESKSIGWFIICIATIFFLFGNIKYKRPNDKNSITEKIAIGILFFVLVVQCFLLFFILNSNAYTQAKMYIYNNEQLKAETGKIEGISIMPLGGMSVSTGQSGETGEGVIYLTVKGTRRYKDLKINLSKAVDTNWMFAIEE